MPHRLPRVLASLLLTALTVGRVGLAQPSASEHYDLLLRGGRILDGSGNPWRRGDVAVRGDRIVAIGRLDASRATRVIELEDRYVTPGFIDVHSHAAPGLASAELSLGRPLLSQGITTIVANPDGGGPVDLVEQRQALLEHGLGPNVALLVPHGTVRRAVLGMEDRPATSAELEKMKQRVREGMKAGAFGLSSGLYYAPGSYSDTSEVIALARVAAEEGGIYTSHIRDEADYSVGLVAAVDEVIQVAREAGIVGIVTHIKALGPRVWGFSEVLVRRIERARDEGVEIYADQYPYDASGTSIGGALVPRWAQAGGDDALRTHLQTPADRARLRAAILENLDRRGGAGRLQFQRYEPDPSIEGRSMAEVAEERGVEPVELALSLLEEGDASLVSFNMDERDIATLMRQPWTMTSSDGGLVPLDTGVPHPRFYGTFPRKIRKYVQELGVIRLEDAVRSMTSLPAAVFGFENRGAIRVGAIADLAVFDLEQFRDSATYDAPHRYASGLEYLLVAGRLVVETGQPTGELAGDVLTRGPSAP